MTPDRDPQTRADAERFDLLEHPERWPEDAASQARLAEILELHLALQAHGPDLAALQRLCRQRPVRAVYSMPTLHNPLGWVQNAHALLPCYRLLKLKNENSISL